MWWVLSISPHTPTQGLVSPWTRTMRAWMMIRHFHVARRSTQQMAHNLLYPPLRTRLGGGKYANQSTACTLNVEYISYFVPLILFNPFIRFACLLQFIFSDFSPISRSHSLILPPLLLSYVMQYLPHRLGNLPLYRTHHQSSYKHHPHQVRQRHPPSLKPRMQPPPDLLIHPCPTHKLPPDPHPTPHPCPHHNLRRCV